MSYDDDNQSGGRYGTRSGKEYGSTQANTGYGFDADSGTKKGTNTTYDDGTGTNVRDQTTSSGPGYGDSTSTNIRDRTTRSGATEDDSYGDPTRTNIRDNPYQSGQADYETSGLSSDPDRSSNRSQTQAYSSGFEDTTADRNRRVAQEPQQNTSSSYSQERPKHTGGGLGERDNNTTSAAATGGAGTAAADEYGMGTGRSYEQEVGGVGGNRDRFTKPETSTTSFDQDRSTRGYGDNEDDNSASSRGDSTKGRLMEKAGRVLHNESIIDRGQEARREAGAYE